MKSIIIKYLIPLYAFVLIICAYLYLSTNPISENMNIKTEGMKILEIEENSILNEYDIELINQSKQQETTRKSPFDIVQLMFSAVYFEKPLLFSQTFLAEQFYKDLLKIQDNLTDEIQGEDAELFLIDRISRNGNLSEVKHIKTTENLFKGTAKTKVVLVYKDDKSVQVTLHLKNEKLGEKGKQSHYFIDTSVWELIEEIEKI